MTRSTATSAEERRESFARVVEALRNYRGVFERLQVDEDAGLLLGPSRRLNAPIDRTGHANAANFGPRGRPTPPKAPLADAAVPSGDAPATQCANVAPGPGQQSARKWPAGAR